VYDSDDFFAAKRGCKSSPKVARWSNVNSEYLMADDVTEVMLDNVADRVSEKIYDQSKGSSCHQCRQKTLNMKTVCRSGRCVGIHGQFCGVCLENRYYKKAREALLNPLCVCPPCPNQCNCSICRNRKGKKPTGIMVKTALRLGFKSVKHFLDRQESV